MMLAFPSVAHAFKIHFNQAWFKTHYAHSYRQGFFDPLEVRRIMNLAKEAGSDELRLWFFESSVGSIPKPTEISHMIQTLKIAQAQGMRVYFTFFDAWSQAQIGSLFTEQGSNRFLHRVVIPLFHRIESEGLSDVISKIDLVNEGDALIDRKIIPGGWEDLKSFICQWKVSIHTVNTFRKIPITLSLRLNPYASLPADLFEQTGTMECVDFFDFHSYHTQGVIEQCDLLKRYSDLNLKNLVLGEFGQGYDAQQFDDQLQLENAKSYLNNAQACGFKEAFAWRLSDIRPGENPEARFSYEAFGTVRPAYYFVRDWNHSQH
jgi:hypothetical protein